MCFCNFFLLLFNLFLIFFQFSFRFHLFPLSNFITFFIKFFIFILFQLTKIFLFVFSFLGMFNSRIPSKALNKEKSTNQSSLCYGADRNCVFRAFTSDSRLIIKSLYTLKSLHIFVTVYLTYFMLMEQSSGKILPGKVGGACGDGRL